MMKKAIALLITIVMLTGICALSVSAAGDINANEQKILDKLSETITVDGKKFVIPANYVNQAKNYFLTTDVTEAQTTEVMGYLNEGETVIKAQAAQLTGTTVDLSSLDTATKSKILDLGKKASSVVDLTLTYDNGKVSIVETATGKTAFVDTPVVKITGAQLSVTVALLAAAVVVFSFCAAAFASKKVTVR